METVIAIPIYLVVIGGTLWLGDLNLARQRLLMADRYASWNKGNRHGGASAAKNDLWETFFNEEKDQDIKQVKVKAKVDGWYVQVAASTKAKITMPDWTHGMINAGVTWDADKFDKSQTMTGRDGDNLIVMRAGSRDQSMDQINWRDVKKDKWWPSGSSGKGGSGGGGGGGKGGKMSMADKYTRYGTFENWSD